MPSSRPALLIVPPHLGMLSVFLEPDFTVWRFWEGPPVEAVGVIEALVVSGEAPLDKALAEAMPRLKLIACLTADHGGIDLDWARRRGLQVSHAPGADPADVADHAFGLLLAAWRRITDGDADVRTGAWRAGEKRLTPSLAGRRLGIVGLGAVGTAVAERARPFGLEIAWWGPREKPEAPWPRVASLVALAEASDILVVACRPGGDTRGLVDATILDALGPAGLIVDVSAGGIVAEAALIEALRSGRLGMAALDVFETEPAAPARWSDVPNTLLTPHSAGATSGALPRAVALVKENLRRFFAGEPLVNPVELEHETPVGGSPPGA